MKQTFVSYLRVSTSTQERSGLGLESQREAVTQYVDGSGGEVIAEFVERESGKRDDRPQLAAAIARCKADGATLVIARLDRLSRGLSFIANLMDSRVKFKCCDMPEADEFTLHIFAALAQKERQLISSRTRAALQAAKARGQRLGCPCPEIGSAAGARASRKRADEFANKVLWMIKPMRESGKSLSEIAQTLNRGSIKTRRGGNWYPATVSNILKRDSVSPR